MCLAFLLENIITGDEVGDLEIDEALLAYFPYFEKNKSRLMRSLSSLCVCVSHIINLWMPELIFMKLGMYIMTPEPISKAYLMNPISLCVCMCIPLSLLGNGSVETLPLQRIHTQQKKNYGMNPSLYGPCRIKESRRLVL
jgi:hypothetical protein